ncbi:MAG: RluA family pseudouridine synthase [Saprospiraceae bacterium]|nr:RluA family pseudouridine synthase [Saprospiraceae bacterium]MDW8230818.1 RluA family pseudouridine synthase [Saprospiraceae bacterium]
MAVPQVCYEDDMLLALNKPPGMPAQPDPTGDMSLLTWAEERCGQALHLVNRLDRPVSGLMLLAKNAQAMAHAQQQFRDGGVCKEYLAIVGGMLPASEGELTHFLTQNPRTHRAYAHAEECSGAVRAVLRYRLIGKGERYAFLHVQPLTGRHHQIRAQLSAIGCPIKGDVRYGARRANTDRSIYLHAWRLTLQHPVSGQMLRIEAPFPQADALWAACEQALQAGLS